MKLKLAIIIMVAGAILAMAATATASVKLGTTIEEAGVGTGGVTGIASLGTGGVTETGGYSAQHANESIENIVQIASEVSRIEIPEGWHLVNETIVGDYYVAYIDANDFPCGENVSEKTLECFHPHNYHILVHKLGSNETTIYDLRVWVLSEEYGKG